MHTRVSSEDYCEIGRELKCAEQLIGEFLNRVSVPADWKLKSVVVIPMRYDRSPDHCRVTITMIER